MNYKLNRNEFKKALLTNGLTIASLSGKANVSSVTFDKLINHDGNVRAKTALKIANALNVKVTELFF